MDKLVTVLVLVAVLALAVVAPTPCHAAAWMMTGTPDQYGQFTFEFDPGPIAIYRANGYRQWDDMVPMPAGLICEVRTFVGWDRGSLGEANLELNVGNFRLYERSEHKESPANYDAWKTRPAHARVTAGQLLHMHSGAVQTGANVHDGGLSTRVHFSIRLRMTTGTDCVAY